MINYENLKTVLNETKSSVICNNVRDTNLKTTVKSYEVLGATIWRYNFSKKDIKLANSTEIIDLHSYKDLKIFLNHIKPCFKNYFVQFLILFIKFLSNGEGKVSFRSYAMRSIFPIKNEYDEYNLTSFFVLPEIVNNTLVDLYFISLPLKEYNLEPISIYITGNLKKDVFITNKIKSKIKLKTLLTKEQKRIFKLINKGYSSNTIAGILDKKLDNILKYNIRINSRISTYFDTPFDSVKTAANYYKSCFSYD